MGHEIKDSDVESLFLNRCCDVEHMYMIFECVDPLNISSLIEIVEILPKNKQKMIFFGFSTFSFVWP